METKFKAAIIGLGRIASVLEDDTKREKPASHAGALVDHGGFEIIGGCDTDPDRREVFGHRWGVKDLFSRSEDLFAKLKPDLAVIATHPDSHDQLVREAVKAKVKLVICEKPLTPTPSSSRKLFRYCDRSGTILMVNHERRYARDYRRVRDLILQNTYGKLLSIFAKIYMGRTRTPAEVLFWDGTHMLDILRFLTAQEFKGIRSWGHPHISGDTLLTSFRLGSAQGVMEVGTGRDHLVFELDLSFQRGRVRIGNGVYEEWMGGESPHYEKMRSLLPVDVDPKLLYPTEYFSAMVKDAFSVLEALKSGEKRTPISRGEDGWRAVDVIKQILAKSTLRY